MMTEEELLERIKTLVGAGKYVVANHVTQHMFAEGFTLRDLIEAVTGKSRIIEVYERVSRCLVGGYFQLSKAVQMPLHVVIEYTNEEEVTFVTAYIPQKPWWTTPWRRGRSK
jgi:hypothetical protein